MDKFYDELVLSSNKTCCVENCLIENIDPQWLDKEKIKNARVFVKKHFASVMFAHFCGLVLVVYLKSILIPLLSTGKSKSISYIFIRYLQTILHVKLWYEQDIWDRNSEAHASILNVQKMHSSVSNKLNAGKVIGKDIMSLSQLDMVLTQLAFVGFIVLFPKQMGISCTQKQLEDYLHLWRAIGYILGIEDRYNLCDGNIDNIKLVSQYLIDRQLKPSIRDSSIMEAIEMSKGIVEAIRYFGIYFLTWESLAKYLFKLIEIQVEIKMSFYSSICYFIIHLTLNYLLHINIFTYIYNNGLRLQLILAQRRQKSIQKMLSKKHDIIFGQSLGTSQNLNYSHQTCPVV